MDSSRSATLLRRLESQFLRPYRLPLALCLLGLFVQSILLLPVSLLQGWVLARLLAHPAGSPGTGDASRAIALGLIVSAVCHLGRMALAWKVTTTVGRISQ